MLFGSTCSFDAEESCVNQSAKLNNHGFAAPAAAATAGGTIPEAAKAAEEEHE